MGMHTSNSRAKASLQKIIFIASDARSGSTMLDLLLASHDRIVSVGELRHLQEYLERNDLCMCGKPVLTCGFWRRIENEVRKMAGNGRRFELKQLRTKIRRTRKRIHEYLPSFIEMLLIVANRESLEIVGKYFKTVRDAVETAKNCITICQAVSSATGRPFVVDSSKWAEQFKLAYLLRPDLAKIIFLVRDGRGVAFSQLHRSTLNVQKATVFWVLNNIKIILMKLFMAHDMVLFVRYEDLCQDPGLQIGRILRFIGVVRTADQIRVKKVGRHNIGGSPHRFDRSQEKIFLDERWRQGLSKIDLIQFNRIGGMLNKYFGYAK